MEMMSSLDEVGEKDDDDEEENSSSCYSALCGQQAFLVSIKVVYALKPLQPQESPPRGERGTERKKVSKIQSSKTNATE